VIEGFKTVVYSRSPKPNPKAELVESLGVEYLSSEQLTPEQLAERVGNIDLVYEAVGESKVSFEVMKVLGINGVFIFTGIPGPKPPLPIETTTLMRNVVLKNQAVVGTVNADRTAFESAIRDLGEFKRRWPDAIRAVISGRFGIESHRELLQGKATGIKNVIRFA
jgi:threonine dehydrogenase-like Zn-dependent dehydrogenase